MSLWFIEFCHIWGTEAYFYIVFRKRRNYERWIGENRSQVDTRLSCLPICIIVNIKWKQNCVYHRVYLKNLFGI